jgi:alkylhydroperoxidase/carboxymuconolactone decarboxylase family protein YurZ
MPVTDEMMKKGLELQARMNRTGSLGDQNALYEDLHRYTLGFLFGEIWQRPHLSLRDRQLITLAANIAQARPNGTQLHYKSAKAVGISHEEIMELIIHVGMYGGWPCMSLACKQYAEALAAEKAAAGKPKKKATGKKKAAAKA